MRRFALLLSLLAGVLVAACVGGADETPKPAAATATEPTTKVIAAPAVAGVRVPTDLVGKTMGDAKATLAKAGFTHVVAAGGDGVTDASTVTEVSHAGQAVAPATKIVLTGAAAEPAPSATQSTGTSGSRQACLRDETQCYMAGQQCATGSCVNAARGLSPEDVRDQTNAWLSERPGYCAAGETGAVAPCGDGSDTTRSEPGG